MEPAWRNTGEHMSSSQGSTALEITVEDNKEKGMSAKAKTQKTQSSSTIKSPYWMQRSSPKVVERPGK